RAGLTWSDQADLVPMVQSPDPIAHVLARPRTDPPGSTFLYSTGLTQVGAGVLAAATERAVDDFAREALFEPLGIHAVRWDVDSTGLQVGGSELFLRPRDLARLGQLVLRRGRVGERELVPGAFLEQATSTLYD